MPLTEVITIAQYKKLGAARGIPVRQPGKMNRTEEAFSEWAEHHKLAGLLLGWWFEAVTFKLAEDLRYTPDFMLLEGDLTATFVETKASFINKKGVLQSTARDDSTVKLKMASSLFPFRFKLAVRRPDKTWDVKEIQ